MNYAQLLLGAVLTMFGIWIGMAFATETDANAVANWWDLMTAFGTVGATVTALFFGLAEQRSDATIRVERLTSVLAMVDEAVQSADWILKHVKRIADPNNQTPAVLAENELSALLTSMDAINRIPFHEVHYSEAHRKLIFTLAALRSLTPLIETVLSRGVGAVNHDRIEDLVEQAKDELEEAVQDSLFRDIQRVGRLYY